MFKMSQRMVLKSTDSPLYHPSNQPDSFRVHLPKPLILNGVWTVSLLEFSLDPGQTKQRGRKTSEGKFYKDHLCAFRCLGVHQGHQRDRLETRKHSKGLNCHNSCILKNVSKLMSMFFDYRTISLPCQSTNPSAVLKTQCI